MSIRVFIFAACTLNPRKDTYTEGKDQHPRFLDSALRPSFLSLGSMGKWLLATAVSLGQKRMHLLFINVRWFRVFVSTNDRLIVAISTQLSLFIFARTPPVCTTVS